MVNRVYSSSEKEFWDEGYYRIDDGDFDEYTRNNWLYSMEEAGQIVGCVLLKPKGERASSFSMLVCHPEHRKKGIGGKLVRHVTEVAAGRGDQSMYLELLAPRDWIHEEKEFLKRWYRGMGYKLVKEVDFRDYYPDHIQFMKCELIFLLYKKSLSE